jgi:gliding motility-associated lipoprotein GldD
MKMNKFALTLIFSMVMVLFLACHSDDYTPKPKSYFRISLPEKKYRLLDSIYPYSFEIPDYAVISADPDSHAEPYWINIDFPKFKGTLHLSYKKVTCDTVLFRFFEDSRTFVNRHIAKADDIETTVISNDTTNVYGILYDISGSGVASTYQFAVTDSTKHFLRAALYFNVAPNNDSMQPVIKFIKQDIDKMIHTLKWKS